MDLVGRGQHSNMYPLSLKANFYRSRVVVSIMLMSGVQNCGRALERMIQYIVLAVRPLPPYVHIASTWCHSRDKCSQAFPVLRHSTTPVYCCERKQMVKMGEAWEQGYYTLVCVVYITHYLMA